LECSPEDRYSSTSIQGNNIAKMYSSLCGLISARSSRGGVKAGCFMTDIILPGNGFSGDDGVRPPA